MRYYEVYYPGKEMPQITTNARRLKDLPAGTKVYHTITDRDGSLVDQEEYPVKNGKVVFSTGNKRSPKLTNYVDELIEKHRYRPDAGTDQD